MDKMIFLREYRAGACAEVMQLFYDTVHSVNTADYDEAQFDAWAPRKLGINDWNNRFLRDYTVVAEKNGRIAGFGSSKSAGYFDMLYVRRACQRTGIATLIADAIEGRFYKSGITTVTTDASITAKPFFEKRGYVVCRKQEVERRGQSLINYKMKKTLGTGSCI